MWKHLHPLRSGLQPAGKNLGGILGNLLICRMVSKNHTRSAANYLALEGTYLLHEHTANICLSIYLSIYLPIYV